MVIGTRKFTMSSKRLKMRNHSYSVKNCSKQNFDQSIRFQLSFKTSCPSFKSIVATIFKLLQFFCFLGSSKMRYKKNMSLHMSVNIFSIVRRSCKRVKISTMTWRGTYSRSTLWRRSCSTKITA